MYNIITSEIEKLRRFIGFIEKRNVNVFKSESIILK